MEYSTNSAIHSLHLSAESRMNSKKIGRIKLNPKFHQYLPSQNPITAPSPEPAESILYCHTISFIYMVISSFAPLYGTNFLHSHFPIKFYTNFSFLCVTTFPSSVDFIPHYYLVISRIYVSPSHTVLFILLLFTPSYIQILPSWGQNLEVFNSLLAAAHDIKLYVTSRSVAYTNFCA